MTDRTVEIVAEEEIVSVHRVLEDDGVADRVLVMFVKRMREVWAC